MGADEEGTLERLKALRRVAGAADIGWEKRAPEDAPSVTRNFPD
jgi:hypothetical protein